MNRVEFVGNAIFIPFFLLSVGMLIDYRAFFTSFETIKVGAVMIVVATAAKFIAAWLTQKTFRMSVDQRRVIFGLEQCAAAATLAAVLVGYNVISGNDARRRADPAAERERAQRYDSDDSGHLYDGVVFSAEGGAISPWRSRRTSRNPTGTRWRYSFRSATRPTSRSWSIWGCRSAEARQNGLHALTVVDDKGSDGTSAKRSKRLLQLAVETAAATDTRLQELLRYDLSPANAISGVIRECGITDVILGLHERKDISSGFLGRVAEGTIADNTTNVFIYKPAQPLSTRQASSGSPAAAGRKGGRGSSVRWNVWPTWSGTLVPRRCSTPHPPRSI